MATKAAATKAAPKTTSTRKKISSSKTDINQSVKDAPSAVSRSLSDASKMTAPQDLIVATPANTDAKLSKSKTPKKQVSQSIGYILKHVRSTKNLSVFTISQTLCISERYIHAIESMDRSALPEKVYALGFLRSYAQHLGIDPQKAIMQFKAEMYSETKDKQSKALDVPQPVSVSMFPSPKIVLLCLIALCILASALWYWQTTSQQTLEQEITALLDQPEPLHLMMPEEQ